jgi:Domain of unknown function (DU1801)
VAKAELKTKATAVSVADYIAALPDARRREEAAAIDALYRRVTGLEPKMWGPSIIGYGSYDYRYESGREGTMCRAGFSPRKAALVFYLHASDEPEAEALFAQLGKHSRGKGCLYVKKLSDVDLAVLERLAGLSWAVMGVRYG